MNKQKNEYGIIYSFDKFYDYVKDRCFIDYDGIGYFIDDDGSTIKPVICDCQWLVRNKPENSNYILLGRIDALMGDFGPTIQDVFEELTDRQKESLYSIIGRALTNFSYTTQLDALLSELNSEQKSVVLFMIAEVHKMNSKKIHKMYSKGD